MTYSRRQMEYIDSVGGAAHMSAVEIIGELEAALIAGGNHKPAPTHCHWQLPDEYEEPWQGDCGILCVFTDAGTPRQHGMNFCPRCGRALLVVGQEEA